MYVDFIGDKVNNLNAARLITLLTSKISDIGSAAKCPAHIRQALSYAESICLTLKRRKGEESESRRVKEKKKKKGKEIKRRKDKMLNVKILKEQL